MSIANLYKVIDTPHKDIKVTVVGYEGDGPKVRILLKWVRRHHSHPLAALRLDPDMALDALAAIRASQWGVHGRSKLHVSQECGYEEILIGPMGACSMSLPRETWITVLTAVEAAVKGGAA